MTTQRRPGKREGDGSSCNGAVRALRGSAVVVLGTLCILLLPREGAHGQTPPFPRISLIPYASGFAQPVQVTSAGDGSGTLYLVEQGGRIRAIRNGIPDPSPFLDISGRVLSGGERGLLGLAFAPGYAANGRFYVDYTRTPDGATVVARFLASGSPRVADPSSEEVLLVVPQPFPNHNGGQIAFGPDGYLYVGMGDGGSGGDPGNNAQNPAALLGKMLRIDVESGAVPYAVPPSNPFVGSAGFRGEIWALGLRNPWRFSFDRATGDLFLGDVGQSSFEEIDFQPAGSPGGENYGWNVLEGNHCFLGAGCDATGMTPPVAEYDHSLGCSVTGGAVYRGSAHPAFAGIYFYGDYCSGRIFGLVREGSAWRSEPLLTAPISISSFGEDDSGDLYVIDYGGGAVYRVVPGNNAPAAPALVAPADGQGGLPGTVEFRWSPSADPDGDPVTYLFFLGTDSSFAGVVPVPLSRPPAPTGGAAACRFLLLPVAAFALSGLRRRKGPVRAAILFLILSAGVLPLAVPGCGGGGAAPVSGTQLVAHRVSGLAPGTVYFWKVAADDGTDAAESATRSFTTGLP